MNAGFGSNPELSPIIILYSISIRINHVGRICIEGRQRVCGLLWNVRTASAFTGKTPNFAYLIPKLSRDKKIAVTRKS